MSAICILVPTVIAGWPAFSTAVAGAAAALGLNMVKETTDLLYEERHQVQRVRTKVEIDVDAEVLNEQLNINEELVLTKDTITIRVRRNARGEVKVCVEGELFTKAQLQEIGEELVHKITQVFVYNKVMSELRERGFNVVQEQISEDESVHLHVRRDAN